MSFSTILFTEKGRALQAKSEAGVALTFTKIAMGAGSLSGQSPLTLTDLIDLKVNLAITNITHNSNYATVKGHFSNADINTGFYWREIGVFAQDPDLGEILYCYGNAGALAEYIPPIESEIIEKVVGLSVIIGDATSVSAIINESLVYATKADINLINDELQDIKTNVLSEKYQTASGTETAIILTDLPLEDGRSKTFIAKYDNNGSATTINGKSLYKPGTTTSPKFSAGKAVTVWFNAAGDCFFFKASATGNTVAEHVLAPDTFSNENDTDIVGTMADNGPEVAEIVNLVNEGEEYVISKGYHSGLRKIKAAISGLVAGVIKSGVRVGNILGTYTSDATATDPEVLNGEIYYRNGVKGTGNMPNRGTVNQSLPINGSYTIPNGYHSGAGKVTQSIPTKSATTITPGTANQVISAGQYLSGAITVLGDADLISSKLPTDLNLFGIQGIRSLGKKFASGSVTASAGGITADFTYSDGYDTVFKPYVEVTGLDFTPDIVIVIGKATLESLTVYTRLQNSGLYADSIVHLSVRANQSTGEQISNFKGNAASARVVYGSFLLPVTYFTIPCTWIAYEQ